MRHLISVVLALPLVFLWSASCLGGSPTAVPLEPRNLLKQEKPKSALAQVKANSKRYKEGELLVKFRPGRKESRKNDLHARHGSRKIADFEGLRIHHVKLKEGVAVAEAIQKYKNEPDVEYAEPNFELKPLAVPNDPNYPYLWAMPLIHAPEAWARTKGSSEVVVAVIDTGVDYTHPDLSANIWRNPGEIPGNSIDDDGNGYVDDVFGIDVYNVDSDPLDDHGHGTHVAGTIGAVGNNATGVVGVNWSVKIIGCKFIGKSGYGFTSGAIACLEYLRKLKSKNVNIVASNNSWGGDDDSQALADAIAAQEDTLFIAAAGNDYANNDKMPFFPAGYGLPNLISVAATDSFDKKAYFSNYGRRKVHIGAPGMNIYSTVSADNNYDVTGGYESFSGTSMAAPHVTGLTALLKAQQSGRDWRAIKNLLLAGGDPIPSMTDTTISGRRINAEGSLNCGNRPLFSITNLPSTITAGSPVPLTVLSINCGSSVGPVTAVTTSGDPIDLRDDGTGPDAKGGDGIFSGTWTPSASTVKLTVTSAAGEESVGFPALELLADPIGGRIGTEYRHRFEPKGGLPPYSWSVVSGQLPDGLSLSGSGEIFGIPERVGTFDFAVQLEDAWGFKVSHSYSITVDDQMVVELWTRTFNGGDRDGGKDVALDRDGNVLVTGITGVSDGWWGGTYSYLTRKYDPDGNLLWSATSPSSMTMLFARGQRITSDQDGNVFAMLDDKIVKYDPAGNELWTRWYSDDDEMQDYAFDIAADPQGNVHVTGVSYKDPAIASRTVKFDTDGNILSTRIAPGISGGAIAFDTQGNMYLGEHVSTEVRLSKFSPSGTLVWSRSYETSTFSSYSWVVGVAVTPQGEVYVAGNYEELSRPGYYLSYALKYRHGGDLAWARTGLSSDVWDLDVDKYGYGYLLKDSSCYKLDPDNGEFIWKKTFHGDPSGVAVDGKGSIYLTGELWNQTDYDLKLLKTTDYFIYSTGERYAVNGQPYLLQLSATGVAPPFSWSVSAGSLPQGLSLDPATGEIRGTSTAVGIHPVTVTVTDSKGTSTVRDLSLTVTAITTSSLANSPLNSWYSQQLTATGGAGPYTWTLLDGPLPPGITLDHATGAISGSTTAAGRYLFTIAATDSEGIVSQRTYAVSVFTATNIFNSSYSDGVGGLVVDDKGNFWITGSDGATFIAMYDAAGRFLWQKRIEKTWQWVGPAAAVLSPSQEPFMAGADGFLYRFDRNGTSTWEAQRPTGLIASPYDMKLDPEGNFFIAGDEQRSFAGAKLDPIGNLLWKISYPSSVYVDSMANGVVIDSSGNAYFSGRVPNGGYAAGRIVKVGPTGQTLWERTVTDNRYGCEFYGSVKGKDDSVSVVSTCSESGWKILTYDSSGTLTRQLPLPAAGYWKSIALGEDGSFYVTGTNDHDYLTLRIDPELGVIWSVAFDNNGFRDYAKRIAVDGSGVVYVTGSSENQVNYLVDVVTVRYFPPVIITPDLPSATHGLPYNLRLIARSGVTPFTWTILAGSIPPGLTFDAATGTLSGTPTATGSYSFTVKIADSMSLADIRRYSLAVELPLPVASFTASALIGEAPLLVNFSDTSQNAPTEWTWQFGDGSGSATRNPAHVYTAPGQYSVRLTARHVAGSDSKEINAYVTVLACMNRPVRIGAGQWYDTMQSAYDAAQSGDTIHLQALPFREELLLSRDISTTLKGGYDCNYATNAADSPVSGALRVTNGKVSIDKLRLTM